MRAFRRPAAADGYEAALRAQIARIRRLAGANVPILLLGAPDAGTRSAGIADPDAACGDGWFEPRAARRGARAADARRARRCGVGFWNWAAAMGGRCASHQWRLDRADARRPCPFHPQRRRPDRRDDRRRHRPRARPRAAARPPAGAGALDAVPDAHLRALLPPRLRASPGRSRAATSGARSSCWSPPGSSTAGGTRASSLLLIASGILNWGAARLIVAAEDRPRLRKALARASASPST